MPTPTPAQSPNGRQVVVPTAQTRLNFSNPEDVTSIHTNNRLPSLASHLSNSQIAAITNGEDVDLAILLPFSSLLHDRVNSDLKLQLGIEGLTIPLPSPAQRRKSPVSIDGSMLLPFIVRLSYFCTPHVVWEIPGYGLVRVPC